MHKCICVEVCEKNIKKEQKGNIFYLYIFHFLWIEDFVVCIKIMKSFTNYFFPFKTFGSFGLSRGQLSIRCLHQSTSLDSDWIEEKIKSSPMSKCDVGCFLLARHDLAVVALGLSHIFGILWTNDIVLVIVQSFASCGTFYKVC